MSNQDLTGYINKDPFKKKNGSPSLINFQVQDTTKRCRNTFRYITQNLMYSILRKKTYNLMGYSQKPINLRFFALLLILLNVTFLNIIWNI